jgi:hypothetical protein
MDAGLDENQADCRKSLISFHKQKALVAELTLRILVLAVALKVLADRDGLLDEEVEILWNRRCEA